MEISDRDLLNSICNEEDIYSAFISKIMNTYSKDPRGMFLLLIDPFERGLVNLDAMKKLCEMGYGPAMGRYVEGCIVGENISQDHVKYMIEGSALGNPRAMHTLGCFLYYAESIGPIKTHMKTQGLSIDSLCTPMTYWERAANTITISLKI